MKKKYIPPQISEISQGEVKWQTISDRDFNFLGYFLSCHLIIEHYLESFLCAISKDFNWKNANLTFSQKLILLSEFNFKEPYEFVPALKHLNSLRNKFSHQIDFVPGGDDYLPFIYFIRKVRKDSSDGKHIPEPEEAIEIIEQFTHAVCSWLAGAISSLEWHKNKFESIKSNK